MSREPLLQAGDHNACDMCVQGCFSRGHLEETEPSIGMLPPSTRGRPRPHIYNTRLHPFVQAERRQGVLSVPSSTLPHQTVIPSVGGAEAYSHRWPRPGLVLCTTLSVHRSCAA